MKFLNFFLFLWVIFILLDPDRLTWLNPDPKPCFLKVLIASESSDTIHFKKISEFEWNSVYLSNLDVLPNFIEGTILNLTDFIYIDSRAAITIDDTDKNLPLSLWQIIHTSSNRPDSEKLQGSKRELVSPFLPWGPWPCATWCWACGAWAAGSAASRPRSWGGGTPPSGAARPPSYWNIWPMIHDIGVQQAVLCIRFH